MKRLVAVLTFLLLFAGVSQGQNADLTIVSAGPVGEASSLAEANEIRVVFSEPMVVLGKIPQPVTAPFFKVSPAIKGSFRWSGTTTLIFTPDPKTPLPFATQYTVTIDKAAKAVSGKTLDQPYSWTFTTPTIRLLSTEFYRRNGKADGAVVIALRFNQPVTAETITPHLQVTTEAHEFPEPVFPEKGMARLQKLEPSAPAAFASKKAKAQEIAAKNGDPVFVFIATEWDKTRFPPAKDLVVLETKPGIPPETWLRVALAAGLAKAGSNVRTSSEQSYTIQLPPALFVSEITCIDPCDPDRHNGIYFRTFSGIKFDEMRRALTVTDITDPKNEKVVKPKSSDADFDYPPQGFGLDELGYSMQPLRTYALRVDPSLTAEDGQKLGYTFMAVVEYWHRSAFVSFGDGFGVWESTGGPVLPFHARNYKSVQQWLAAMKIEDVLPVMQRMRTEGTGLTPPDTKPETRKLQFLADKIQYHGLDLTPVIGKDNQGLAWAAMVPGETIPKTVEVDRNPKSTLVQATNLGISVKDSPQNTVVLVTRLDDGKPVAGAAVSIRNRENKVSWTGTTDANGIAVAPNTDLRRKQPDDPSQGEWYESWAALGELHFLVTAEKDGDVAYVASDWNDGISPWEFDIRYDISETNALLRGTIFTDRGVYKLGEEIHLKAVVRGDTPKGMKLLDPGTKLDIVLRDSQNTELDKRTVAVNAWSSAEWTFKLPTDAPLGNYYVMATTPAGRGSIAANFLVAAYRRPEFRVDTTLGANSSLAGTKLDGRITGRYLFGGAMANAAVKWIYSKTRIGWGVPQPIADRWPTDRWSFLGMDYEEENEGTVTIEEKEEALDAKGEKKLSLPTQKDAGWPYEYQLEGVVKDVTRQQIAGRASFRVDPAPWYIGVKTPPYFAEAPAGFDTEIVAAGLDGLAVAGVDVKVELKQLQWTSVRQSEGDGFYAWESERKEIDAGEWTVETQGTPVPLHVGIKEGGEYMLRATATDGQGRSTMTRIWFYALGPGYTAWQRHDHNRIDLVPEKKTYRPGESARIMIKSPWETATALLTTEREGVRTWKQFTLTSSQQTITVPITEEDIPNVFVSVLLVKGRTKQDPGKDGSDPGKPSFRLGYVELQVEDASKRLNVDVKADRDEFRPAAKAKIEVNVKDVKNRPSQSEVTLWAVDYGVLSLTAYQTPDVLQSIYLAKALQVANEDSRQKIISRRVITPKGTTEGGGGGLDGGPGMLRKDFRVLAFWLGSLVTDKNGKAKTEITLPESLTTYRIMAVAGDKQSRFGFAQNELRINKPVMVTPSWPRFLAVGDKAHFGGVIHNQTKQNGTATISIVSLDPSVLEIKGEQKVEVKAGGSAEVRWDAVAKAVGNARVQLRVKMGKELDGFEDVIPVRVFVTPETVAAYGTAAPRAQETLEIPKEVVPGFGGLRLELSSTAMVGLGEGARYLVEYPYGCAEQRSSRALALMLASDLGEAFSLPGIDAAKGKVTTQEQLDELRRFQCADGGFSFWPGECWSTSPYLTAYVLHVYQRGGKLKYRIDEPTLVRGYEYLERYLAQPRPTNEGWMPAYTAWQAFAIKVLAEGGRNVDSHINRLYEFRDRMPVFAHSHLLDALLAKGEKSGARHADLLRRMRNSILPEGGHAFVNELSDPYLLWFWSSNVRSTAIVLGTLVRNGEDQELVTRIVRWLMRVRKDGRWGNTQENAWAMQGLVEYYRKYETAVPDFTAVVTLGAEELAREPFKGRSTVAKTRQFSMQDVLAKAPGGQQVPIVFNRDGAAGTLFYMLRLRYASSAFRLEAMDNGFRVSRSYAVQGADQPSTTFKAGDLIEVTLNIRNTKERRYVAVNDPLPAGTEAVESWFATTASSLTQQQQNFEAGNWWDVWARGGFDHVERHDDRVHVFATRLGEGAHVFRYLVRATTAGTFIAAPAHVEEMYEPEVFGRTATATVEIKK